MNIIEALKQGLTDITNLNTDYIAKIYIEGKQICEKPVDVRLNEVKIPLQPSDVSFVYKPTERSGIVHRMDVRAQVFYPPMSEIVLPDGLQVTVLRYSEPKIINEVVYVDIITKLTNNNILIEKIDYSHMQNKVLKELNDIIYATSSLKCMLPGYSYNWIQFTDEDINNIKKFNASKLLRLIDKLETDERLFYMNNISELIKSNTGFSTSLVNLIKGITYIDTTNRIQAGCDGVHSYYNPRYVLEWLIYVYENNLDPIHKFYLLNDAGFKTNIRITKENVNDYIIKFETPDECTYNYTLTLTNVLSYGSFIKYNIETLSLVSTTKDTDLIVKRFDNLSDKENLLETAIQILRILSGSNITSGLAMFDYYSRITDLLDTIEISEDTEPIMKEED